MFKEEKAESTFEWNMLGDIEEGRPNLGTSLHVSIFRLMQYTLRDILVRDHGAEEADRLFFECGKRSGEEFCRNIIGEKDNLDEFFAELQRTMKDFGIGIFRVESADNEKGSFVVTLGEDLDCSGIPVCSEEVCVHDEGFFTGVLLAYTGKDYTVKEVDCWGSGSRVCRFTVTPK